MKIINIIKKEFLNKEVDIYHHYYLDCLGFVIGNDISIDKDIEISNITTYVGKHKIIDVEPYFDDYDCENCQSCDNHKLIFKGYKLIFEKRIELKVNNINVNSIFDFVLIKENVD